MRNTSNWDELSPCAQTELNTIGEHFLQAKPRALVRKVSITSPELDIVSSLNAVVASNADVMFGSYPVNQVRTQTIPLSLLSHFC